MLDFKLRCVEPPWAARKSSWDKRLSGDECGGPSGPAVSTVETTQLSGPEIKQERSREEIRWRCQSSSSGPLWSCRQTTKLQGSIRSWMGSRYWIAGINRAAGSATQLANKVKTKQSTTHIEHWALYWKKCTKYELTLFPHSWGGATENLRL